MPKLPCRIVLGMISLSLMGAPVASAQIIHFDLSDDFSLTNNPNGAWSYNISGAPIACRIDAFPPELHGWGCFATLDASITKIFGEIPSDWHDAMVGDVIIHVSSSGYPGPMSVAWTAPHAGVISISGRAWDAAFAAGRNASWTLSLNAGSLATYNSIYKVYRTDVVAAFANNVLGGQSLTELTVAEGDVVLFSTYRTTLDAHFMGVEMSIDLTLAPCPGDANGDRVVDFLDLNAVLADFGLVSPGLAGDLDDDGDCDFVDLNLVLGAFGTSC